jgi:hypothetical protein
MGLFDVFKKLFHSSTDNMPAIKQTAAQDNPPLVKITFSQEPPAHSPSPDMVPLSVLVKNAVPTKRGLYPHETLMLDYAHTFSTSSRNNHYPGFWYYEYSVEHPGAVLKSLEKRGFIQPGDLRSAIQNLTVPMIKKELKTIGQKVSGKKAELIDRLLENASLEDLEKKFPVRFYELTESGQQELAENQYVPYLHRHKYMSVWEMNDRLNNKNPRHFGYRDLIWQFFNEESLKHLHEGDMGLYSNTRLNMYEFLLEEKHYEQAFNLLCEVIAYDLSGMGNNEFDDIDKEFRLQLALESDFPYAESSVTLYPGIKQDLVNLQARLKLSDEELRQKLLHQFESISLYRRIFTNQECVEIVMAELTEDVDTLDAIYKRAEKRLRATLKSL